MGQERKEKYIRMFRRLIDTLTPEQLNRQDSEGMTFLHYVCKCGVHELIQPLLEKGADPDILTNRGESPLDLYLDSLCSSWNPQPVAIIAGKRLIDYSSKKTLNSTANTYSVTLLSRVIIHKRKEVLECLLEKNVEIKSSDIQLADSWDSGVSKLLKIKKYVQDRTKHSYHDSSLFGKLSGYLEKNLIGCTLKEELNAAKALERYAREGYTEEAKRLLRTHHGILVSSRISELYKSVIPKELQEELSILAAQDKITGIKWRS